MDIIQLQNLSFCYPGQDRPVLKTLNLCIPQGSFVLLTGPSGCGKTTLLRHLKPCLAPKGTQTGKLLFEGRDIQTLTHREQSEAIGFVQQNPEYQQVTDTVRSELAFGPESLGWTPQKIRRSIAEAAAYFGIESLLDQKLSRLSGGQKQLANLAAALICRPDLLLLDEPTSQLDPIAAAAFLNMLRRINLELGTTILLTEHRMEDVLSLCSLAVVMQNGQFVFQGKASDLASMQNSDVLFWSLPTPMQVWSRTGRNLTCPLDISQGRQWLEQRAQTKPLSPLPDPAVLPEPKNQPALVCRDVWYRYGETAALRGIDLIAYPGEIVCLMGGNGAGKSTLLQLLGGVLHRQRGHVEISGSTGFLPQDPQILFAFQTVEENLTDALTSSDQDRLDRVIALNHLQELLRYHPYDLSGGEQQRLAMAMVLLRQPYILLLDEPTKGLDGVARQELGQLLQILAKQGKCIFLACHDTDFCASFSTRCVLLADGSIIASDASARFFQNGSFYTTAARRMGGDLCPNAVTAADLIRACGYDPPKPSALPNIPQPQSISRIPKDRKRLAELHPKQGRLCPALICYLIIIPLTILSGMHLLDDHRYLLISIIVLAEAYMPMLPAFFRHQLRARELVLLAVLSSLAAAGRLAFAAFPGFKPMLAMVILSAVAFGSETGFCVGSLAMLVSNLFYGQGPWTPWQMLAMGLCGFFSGILSAAGLIGSSRIALCLLGAAEAFLIYGGIMNPAAVLIFQSQPTWEIILSAYAAAIPSDLIHACATVIFLWLLSGPLLEKLERIRIKYGILDCQK